MSLPPVGASLPQPRFWTSALSSLAASVTLRPPGDARVSVRGSIMLQSAVSGPPSLLSGGLKVPSDISWNAPHRIYLSNVILCLSACLSIYISVCLPETRTKTDCVGTRNCIHPRLCQAEHCGISVLILETQRQSHQAKVGQRVSGQTHARAHTHTGPDCDQ